MKDAIKEIIQHGADNIENLDAPVEVSDLHNYLFNEDYFIIGTYRAKEFLNDYGTFDAIEKIREYEQDNFGEVNTDFSDPEKVANMLAYIVGEEKLNECEAYQKALEDDKKLDSLDLANIRLELEEMAKA